MNKIFELAKEADLIQWDTLSSGARIPDHESVAKAYKFAKLIVKECVAQCEKNYVGTVGTHASAHNSAVSKCVTDIKQHFGVQE